MNNNYDLAMIHRGSINEGWVTSAIEAFAYYPWNRLRIGSGKRLEFDKNSATLEWLKAGETDWLVWSDEGIAFPHDAIQKLITFTDEPCVTSALWWHYNPTAKAVYPGIFYTEGDGRFLANTNPETFVPDRPERVLGTGGGFIAIHREVAQTILDATDPCDLDYPFFQTARVSPGSDSVIGYSEMFAMRVRDAGYQFWLLPDVKVTHYETIGLTGRQL